MRSLDIYPRSKLKGNEIKGFDAAKKDHEKGLCIYAISKKFCRMPVSAYANGGMKYAINHIVRERQQWKN